MSRVQLIEHKIDNLLDIHNYLAHRCNDGVNCNASDTVTDTDISCQSCSLETLYHDCMYCRTWGETSGCYWEDGGRRGAWYRMI